MPCRDYYYEHPQEYFGNEQKDKDKEIQKLRKQVSFAESALCGALNVIADFRGDEVYALIEEKDVGINKHALKKWHVKHKELDAKHREEDRLNQLREKLIKEFNPEDLKKLGLK